MLSANVSVVLKCSYKITHGVEITYKHTQDIWLSVRTFYGGRDGGLPADLELMELCPHRNPGPPHSTNPASGFDTEMVYHILNDYHYSAPTVF